MASTIEELTPLAEDIPEEKEEQIEEDGSTEETNEESQTDESTEEVTVTIGDDQPEEEEKAPTWVREVRQRNRELERELKELKRQQTPAAQALGKKPSLSDPDIDYDEDKLASRLTDYLARENAIKEQEAKAQREAESQQTEWNKKLGTYNEHKAALKVPDYDDAESSVQEAMTETQQAIIIKGAKNPALVVLALGKNPGKLKELAGIRDHVEFAFAVANLEAQLKVTKKPSIPSPEKKVSGTGSLSGANENQLERLREEAAKTGDFTKVMAYKSKLAQKAA